MYFRIGHRTPCILHPKPKPLFSVKPHDRRTYCSGKFDSGYHGNNNGRVTSYTFLWLCSNQYGTFVMAFTARVILLYNVPLPLIKYMFKYNFWKYFLHLCKTQTNYMWFFTLKTCMIETYQNQLRYYGTVTIQLRFGIPIRCATKIFWTLLDVLKFKKKPTL